MQDKHLLIESITPLAILKAMTPEAEKAISKSHLGKGLIGIWAFPFRVGRESRARMVDGELVVCHRVGKGNQPTNDAYLIDNGKKLQISREHLMIEKADEEYRITDRESACGTAIGTKLIGSGESRLNDGDIIHLGSNDSVFKFEFITLK